MQGEKPQAVDAVAAGVPEAAGLAPRELALLDYVKLLTQSPHLVTDAATQKLRDAGWNDEQIFEAAFITSLFAFFNRMSDAYGLDAPANGWTPPDQKGGRSAPALRPGRFFGAPLPKTDPPASAPASPAPPPAPPK